MKVKLLDTQTGKTAESVGISTFEWEEGNWACDCNRESFFGNDTQTKFCLGCKRYIVIEASVERDRDYKTTLSELNAGYSKELLIKHKAWDSRKKRIIT